MLGVDCFPTEERVRIQEQGSDSSSIRILKGVAGSNGPPLRSVTLDSLDTPRNATYILLMGYSPLDDGMPTSTVSVCGGPLVLAIWTLILASKDEEGITKLTPKAVKALWSNSIEPRPLEDIQAAWNYLTSPDLDSAFKEFEGRRIIPTEDGRWKVTAHEKYRQRHSGAAYRAKAAARQQRFRDRQAGLLEPAPHNKKHNLGEGQQECLKEDLEAGADALPPTPHETPSQASVAVQETALVPRKERDDYIVKGGKIWEGHYGSGSVDWGRMGAALKPLSKSNPEEVVLAALQRYVSETTHPSPSPQDFKSHFADWLPAGKGAAKTGVARAVVKNSTQANLDALREIKRERGEE